MVTEVQGRSPWHLAWGRLRRNKVALAFGVLFLLLVLFSLAAPLWADHVAHTGPNQNHITDKILVDGQETYVVRRTAHRWVRGCAAATCSGLTRTAVTSWCG